MTNDEDGASRDLPYVTWDLDDGGKNSGKINSLDLPFFDLIGERKWVRLPACQDLLTSIADCTQATHLKGRQPFPRLMQHTACCGESIQEGRAEGSDR